MVECCPPDVLKLADRHLLAGAIASQQRGQGRRRVDVVTIDRDDGVTGLQASPGGRCAGDYPGKRRAGTRRATLPGTVQKLDAQEGGRADVYGQPRPPSSIRRASESAVSIGMAKASSWTDDGLNEKPLEAAVSMAMTWPVPLTSGPPESPGWMSALVWIRPPGCSEVPSSVSLAVICWLSATTEPPGRARHTAQPRRRYRCRSRSGRPSPWPSCPGRPSADAARGSPQLDQGDVPVCVVAQHRRRVGAPVTEIGGLDEDA